MMRFFAGVAAITVLIGMPLSAAGPNYLAWGPAQNIGAPVNLTTSDDGGACLTKDGRTLFFVSNRNAPDSVGKYDIWVSHWDEDLQVWESPINLGPNVNSPVGEFAPAISRDEHWLFFASNRPGTMGFRDLYAAYREHTHDDTGWGPAFNLGPLVNSPFDEIGVTYFEGDERALPQLIFSSARAGNFDVYVSNLNPDGTFAPPVLLTELATSAAEILPAIRHDGLEMFFVSDRAGGLGDRDIWVTTRGATDEGWSGPVNLGPGVNSGMTELFPAITSNNEVLLFLRAPITTPPTPGEIWFSTRAKANQ